MKEIKLMRVFAFLILLGLAFGYSPSLSVKAEQSVTGWNKVGEQWFYYNSDGSPKRGWISWNGKWYFLDSKGVMRTGWVSYAKKWYYLDSSGAMKTGWIKTENKWYYLDANGVMKTGWIKAEGKWYYLDSSGAMKTGWVFLGDTWYYLDGSGAMRTGWINSEGKWYYLESNGAMKTGWKLYGGQWYYLNPSGDMKTGWLYYGNEWYFILSDGRWDENANKTISTTMESVTVLMSEVQGYLQDLDTNKEKVNGNLEASRSDLSKLNPYLEDAEISAFVNDAQELLELVPLIENQGKQSDIDRFNDTLASMSARITSQQEKNPFQSIFEESPQVAHGLGYIDGHYVTNAIEALYENYERGFRVFEVDLIMTSDNRLVARHDWTLGHYDWLGQETPDTEGTISFDEVMSLKIHGKYPTASWEDLLEVMQKYPDIYIITDTKETEEEMIRSAFSYLVNSTKQVDPSILDRIIPQIYHQPMLGYIKSYHEFKEVIYTLYKHTNADIPTPNQLAEWSAQNNISAIAAFPFRLTEETVAALKKKEIAIYAHTINNAQDAEALRQRGIGIYTDYLLYNGEGFVY